MNGSVGDDHTAAHGHHREDARNPLPGHDAGDSDQFDTLLQLHTRFAALQKREHQLAQRLQQAEQERNDLRRRLDHADVNAGPQSRHLSTEQNVPVDSRLSEIKAREAAVHETEQLLEQQQQELREQQRALQEQRQRLAATQAELEQHRSETQPQHSEPMDRSSLRSQIEREIEIERTALLQLQSTLELEKQQHVDELAARKREYDDALAGLDARLETERQQIRESLIPVIESEFREKLGTVDEARDAVDLERETTLEELRRQAAELEEQREEFEQRIAIEREQLERDFERQRHELQAEKALFQKRYRFQFDHLQQSRSELEESLRIHRREEQAFRVASSHFEAQLQRRMKQVDKFLNVVRDREESVERQSRQARQTLREQLQELSVDRDRLCERQTRWEKQRSVQQADLHRQERQLESHAQNLEDRRVRLEELRLELEDTHQTTLEMRMAVEEAFAQLAQATGAEHARSRIETARAAVADHYRHIREGIARQRAEIEASQSQLQIQRDEFRGEREQLTQWMADRDERQRAQQIELDQQFDLTSEWEAKWRQARDAWKQERQEAELVIRDLLRQLTALHLPALQDDDVCLSDDAHDGLNPVASDGAGAGPQQPATTVSGETGNAMDRNPIVLHTAGDQDDAVCVDVDVSSGDSIGEDSAQILDRTTSQSIEQLAEPDKAAATGTRVDMIIGDVDEVPDDIEKQQFDSESIVAAEVNEAFSADTDDQKEAA